MLNKTSSPHHCYYRNNITLELLLGVYEITNPFWPFQIHIIRKRQLKKVKCQIFIHNLVLELYSNNICCTIETITHHIQFSVCASGAGGFIFDWRIGVKYISLTTEANDVAS